MAEPPPTGPGSSVGALARRGQVYPSPHRAPVPPPVPSTREPMPHGNRRGGQGPRLVKVPAPGESITELPAVSWARGAGPSAAGAGARPDAAGGPADLLAWTVDDGSNAEVIRLYTEFASRTGTRLTFFANGSYDGWTSNAALLRPLVANGQIQLANHTFSHADLTDSSDDEVIAELQQNHDFLQKTYGIDARPFFRPPYGYHDARTDRLAASIGYTTPVLWYGSLSDSGLITSRQVVDFADQWFLPQHIVIGHLNYLPVTEVFDQLAEIIRSRGLQTVTLNDVYSR